MAEIVSLAEAVRRAVHDGDAVAMEGFTHLIPFAAGHEVIRQRRRDLTLIRMTAHVPGGAHPSYAMGYSVRDNDYYVAWDAISRDRGTFSRWLHDRVYGAR